MNKKKWYSKAPEKKNRSWSHTDRVRINSLRQNNKSVGEIINILGGNLTKAQIYNQIRISKGSLHSKCFICRSDLVDLELQTMKTKHNMYLCTSCRNKQKDYKEKRKASALNSKRCYVCGTKKIIKGKNICKNCISSSYRRRLSKGLCGLCGKNDIRKEGGSLCDSCLNKINNFAITHRY